MGKIAIVLGATGVVGSELVDQLAKHNSFKNVISITRRKIDYQSPKVVNQVVDFDDLKQEHFRGDVLFSALGTTRKQAGSIQAQRKVDVEYQFNIAELAARSGVEQYLLVSSSGANAESSSAYLKMKGDLEQMVQTLPFKRTVFVRPSLLLGDRSEFRLGEKIGAAILPLLCKLPGLKKYRPIKGSQVAKAMIRLSEKPGEGVEGYDLDELFGL